MENAQQHNMTIGSKLFYTDAPDTMVGIVVRFTNKRDVIVKRENGEERSYPISVAKGFICK